MRMSSSAPTRPALRYHGGKWRLASWLIAHFPADHDLYCVPYGGAMSDLLRKKRSALEIYNDLDGEIVNYFQMLRERPDELIRAIELTPFAKEEFQRAYVATDNQLEAARRLYIRSYMSIEGVAEYRNGHFRRQRVLSRRADGTAAMTPAAVSFAGIDHLWTIAARLRGVTIECDEALNVIQRYDTPRTLFYVDPPYPAGTRKISKAYRHEMTDKDHQELAGALHECEGMVVLSGYQCPLYNDLFGDWKRVEKLSRTNGKGSKMESLWLSPAAEAALEREKMVPKRKVQMNLF